MTYNTDLQSNNVELQEILNTINTLPEAGGGGGAAIETCTVTFSDSTNYAASVLENGEIVTRHGYLESDNPFVPLSIENVVKNSVMYLGICLVEGGYDYAYEGCTVLYNLGSSYGTIISVDGDVLIEKDVKDDVENPDIDW